MINVRQSIGGLGNLMFKQAYLYTQMLEGVIPDVYVQSPKFWNGYIEEVRNLFKQGIEYVDKVSLHIRRGDYVKNEFYVDLCTTDYYQEAVKHFQDETFLVFCKDNQGRDEEDRIWVKAFMDSLGVPYEFAPMENSEIEDMNLMASCKGHIIANSTFSWWSAFLGGGKTIAPKRWFSDGIQRVDLLDDWIQL